MDPLERDAQWALPRRGVTDVMAVVSPSGTDDGDRLASGDVVGVERHRRCLTTRPGRGHRDDGPERGGHTSDGGTDDAPWGPATSHDGSAGPGSPSEVQVEMTSSQAMINGATLG